MKDLLGFRVYPFVSYELMLIYYNATFCSVKGKMLVKDLSGFRSIHAAGRYRIIYKVDKHTVIIYVLATGIRKQGDKKDKT
jgi:mRNA-degrading endonuclease RelE of RelBE toxin-antitoxin system